MWPVGFRAQWIWPFNSVSVTRKPLSAPSHDGWWQLLVLHFWEFSLHWKRKLSVPAPSLNAKILHHISQVFIPEPVSAVGRSLDLVTCPAQKPGAQAAQPHPKDFMGEGRIPTWNQVLLLKVGDWMLGVPGTQVVILPTCGFPFMQSSEEQHSRWLMAPFMAKVTDCVRDFNSNIKQDLGGWF